MSHVGGNVNNNICRMDVCSEVTAVCEISKRYSGRWVHLSQKCTRVILPRNTSTGDQALERVLVGIRHQRNYKTSCAEAVHLFEDRSKAKGIVEGFQKPCAPYRQLRFLSSYSTDGCH